MVVIIGSTALLLLGELPFREVDRVSAQNSQSQTLRASKDGQSPIEGKTPCYQQEIETPYFHPNDIIQLF